jgi:transcriptional regulator with XRE-family HTH domain
MSIAERSTPGMGDEEDVPIPLSGGPLHRLAAVRQRQGMSLRSVARQMNVEASVARAQEQETTDLSLSDLHKWQQVLGVPIAELLVDAGDDLSPPIRKRAQMVRVMKTAMSILELARQPSIERLAQTLVNHLVELMPELRDVAAWHTVGQRRRLDEYGRAAGPWLLPKLFNGLE